MAMPNFTLLTQMLALQASHGAAEILTTQHGLATLRAALAAQRRKNVSLFAVELHVEPLAEDEQSIAETGGLVCFRVVLRARDPKHKARGKTATTMRAIGIDVDRVAHHVPKAVVDEAERIQREYKRYADWCSAHPGATDEDKIAAGWAEQVREDREFERMVGQKKTGTGEGEKGEKGSQDFFEQKFGF